jgi:hypothetical protein
MGDRSECNGLASGRTDLPDCLGIQLVFPERGAGGSAAIPIRATDGQAGGLSR